MNTLMWFFPHNNCFIAVSIVVSCMLEFHKNKCHNEIDAMLFMTLVL